jgi:hypothetical protein
VDLHDRPGRLYRRLGESLWERRARRVTCSHTPLRYGGVCGTTPASPGWVRAATPPLAVLHALVLVGLAPLARVVRRALRRSRT